MEKINIAEILKDCPKGMELDCVMFENVTFEGIKHDEYPIIVKIKEPPMALSLTKYGGWNLYNSAKCVIFPKGKTTWEGFVAPYKFKDGDVCYIKSNALFEHIFIFKFNEDYKHIHGHVDLSENHFFTGENPVCATDCVKEIRLATEEEKQKLFDAIKAKGYKWNDNTKTLEKLVEPRFKIGNRIKSKTNKYEYTIIDITKDDYIVYYKTDKFGYHVPFCDEDKFELVPDKFDVTTLVPFDSKVLVRDTVKETWKPDFFGCLCDGDYCPYMVVGGIRWKYCIPYEGNEHLLGTTDDCDKYYKNWE